MEENVTSIEEYNKLISQVKDRISFEQFVAFPNDVKLVFINKLTDENLTKEYSSLNSDIKQFISAAKFNKMPTEIQQYLQKDHRHYFYYK